MVNLSDVFPSIAVEKNEQLITSKTGDDQEMIILGCSVTSSFLKKTPKCMSLILSRISIGHQTFGWQRFFKIAYKNIFSDKVEF